MDDMIEFQQFRKIPRLLRECVVTEKIDGTNAVIYIGDDGSFLTGSRNRWITPDDDNYGFSKWAHSHKEELMAGLGPGRHYGEWWGKGIQRGYGINEKRFSLFNVGKWGCGEGLLMPPGCCSYVHTLGKGIFTTDLIDDCIERLRLYGSLSAPGFMDPEGIVIYHIAAGVYFKRTIHRDEEPKRMG